MEDLPYDLSMALKESSQAVEQTVRRHNRKRRGKKRRSNPNLDFDLIEVDFPNRSDASSGGGGGEGSRRLGLRSIAVDGSGATAALTVPPSVGVGFTTELVAAAAGAAAVSAESSLAGGGAVCLPSAPADLSHCRPAGRTATSAASAAARSDSDDVHIVTRLSALTLPPSAAQLPARLAAATAGVTATAKVPAGGSAPAAATGAAAAAAATSVVCGTASSGRSLVKDLESDSVNEKSPAKPLNQRRRRRLRHMLVDDAGDVPGDGGSGAAGGAPIRGGRSLAAALLLPPHGRSRSSDVGSVWSSVGASATGSGSHSLAPPHAIPAARQLWKRKRKQKMDTSDEPPVPHSATRRPGAAAFPVDELLAAATGVEDDRMQAEQLSSELSSTSSEDESTVGRWRRERGGGAAYDDAQEGDDEQSDFFHEPGPSYGVPPVAVAASWWGKENERGFAATAGGGYAAAAAAAACSSSSSVAAGDGFRDRSYFGYRTQSKNGSSSFLTSPAGDDRFSSHRHFSKLDRPFRIGRRRLKSAGYRPHDESILYTSVAAASSSRGACPLIVPSPLAQQLSQSSDVKRRRKAMLPPAAFDESAGSASAVSRSILIPNSSSTSAFSAGGNRAKEGMAHASL